MYGILLLNMQEFVIKTYGRDSWEEIRKSLKIKDVRATLITYSTMYIPSSESRSVSSPSLIAQVPFNAEETFPEGQLIKMGKKSTQLLGVKDDEFYSGMGMYFVELTAR